MNPTINPHTWKKFYSAQMNMKRFFYTWANLKRRKDYRRFSKWARECNRHLKILLKRNEEKEIAATAGATRSETVSS